MNWKTAIYKDEGNILIMSVVIMALLVATGLGYMRWAADESWDSAYEEATVQAYFVAQRGLIEQGLKYLRTREPGDLPQGTVLLPSKQLPNYGDKYQASYNDTKIVRVVSLGSGSVFQRSDTYDIYSTGRTHFYNNKLGNHNYGSMVRVERTATMRTRLRSFANYMYLTHHEKTRFDEIIWFWDGDTLYGRTHSNDYIGLKYSPHFYGPISTSQDRFLEYDAHPHFEYDPQFNVPPVYFPTEATSIRSNASPFIPSQNGSKMTWIRMMGGNGIDIFQYPLGTPRQESLYVHLNPPNWQAIFVDGECEVEGELTGTLTIGSAGNMWLIDNIRYSGADARTGWFESKPPAQLNHMLGLVSESNIIIKDNTVNGKNNGFQVDPNNHSRHSIIINAGMIALGESFTFEHQNDDWDLYQGNDPYDERGYIYLVGAVTQWRRGYVHRSNHIGTGYLKSYNYDFRFDRRPPPYYLEATDEKGHGLFDIISWGEQ
jgi:hypothetical protein